MSWSRFNTGVEFTVGNNTYLIPIWNMSISSGPYAREIQEATAIRAFDGRHYQLHQGWRSRATFNWPEMTPASQTILHDFIVDLVSVGVCTVDFNPNGSPHTINMVVEDATETLQAVFDNAARNRPAALTMVSQNISSVAPPWITDAVEADTIMWISDSGKFYVTSADFSVTIEPNSSWDFTSYLAGDSFQTLEYDPVTSRCYFIKNGTVYSFNVSGTGTIDTHFTTAYSDMFGLIMNVGGRRMALTAHNLAPFNHRWKLYDFDGNELFDAEFRSGLGTLEWTKGQYDHNTGWYHYASGNSMAYVELNPFDVDGLGCLSHGVGDVAIDEVNRVRYNLASPGLFYAPSETPGGLTCSTNDTLLSNVPNQSTELDVFHHDGQVWLVGGGSTSFKVQSNGQGYAEDWVPAGESIHVLCTKRPLNFNV